MASSFSGTSLKVFVGGGGGDFSFCFGPKLKSCSIDLDLDQGEQKGLEGRQNEVW